MRECLKCKKDISDKHESAKFCSTSCRVMYNRKNGKQNEVKLFQMQVLYNQLLDVLDKINQGKFLSPKFEAANEPQQHLIKKSVWDEQPKQVIPTYGYYISLPTNRFQKYWQDSG